MSNMTNEELLQKAAITTDALASAGKLNPAQSAKFLDYVVEEAKLKSIARVERMSKGEAWEIDKIGVGRRVAVPASEAQDPKIRRGVTTSKVTVVPKEIMVPFELGDQFKQVNIEGDDVEDVIVRMMARQAANDLEELFLNGNTLGAAVLESEYMDGGSDTHYRKDSYLALYDGFLRLADAGGSVDAAGANVAAAIFGQAMRQMPTKFRRNRQNLRWLMPSDILELWNEKIAARATGAGDAALTGFDGVPKIFGVPAIDVPLMPFESRVVEHVTLNGTTAVNLRYAPVKDVVVTPSTLGVVPTAAYISATDYTVSLANGTIVRIGGGAITDGQVVKVTYTARPQILLTALQNLIIVLAKEITIEKDRDIFRGVNQYAIRMTAGVGIEEDTALVKVKNLGTSV